MKSAPVDTVRGNDRSARGRTLFFLALYAFALVALRFAALPLDYGTDASTYVDTALSFIGDGEAPLHPERMLKPLAPAGIALILTVWDVEPLIALWAEAAAAFFIFVFVSYGFFSEIFSGEPSLRRRAFVATLFLISGYPMLRYGLDLYTETGAMAFVVAGFWLALRYLRTSSRSSLFFAAIIGGIGFLWKEYSIVSLGTLGLATIVVAMRKRSVTTLFADWAIAFCAAGVTVFPWLVFVWNEYQYTYLDWLRIGRSVGQATLSFVERLFIALKSMVAIALLAWVPALDAVLTEYRERTAVSTRIALCAAPCATVFLWGSASSRLYYVFAPAIIALAVFGIEQRFGNRKYVYVLCVISILAADLIWLFLADIIRPFYASLES